MRVAFIALLLVLLPAAAQVPSAPAASVEITSPTGNVAVSVEQASVVDLKVTNTAQATGTPLDQPRTIGVDVSGVPQGWTVSLSPASFRLAPNESKAVTMRIQVSSAGEAGPATLTVTAHMYALGVSVVPVVGSAIDPEATDSVDIEATRNEGLDRSVVEALDGPWIFVVLFALLAAITVSTVLIARNRHHTVALRAEASTVSVEPGGRAVLGIDVQNLARAQDTVLLRVSDMPDGWVAFLPIAELPLAPAASQKMDLVVVAPPEAKTGTRHNVLVTATGSLNPRRPASVNIEALVEGTAVKRKTR